MAKPVLVRDKKSLVAIAGGDGGKGVSHVQLENDADIKAITKIVTRRKELGVQLSRALIGHGLISADDDEETVVG